MKKINLQLFALKKNMTYINDGAASEKKKTENTPNPNVSIVDYLNGQGQDSSYSAREGLAASLGIANYTGTAEQNTQMLNALKNGVASGGTSQPVTKQVQNNGINGVDEETIAKIKSGHSASDKVNGAQAEAGEYLNKLKDISSVTDIVDQSTWDAINKQFSASTAYQDAMAYTNELLKQLSSGKTSYTDQIKDLMAQIQGRDDFSYDVDTDPLFQQALASAMGSGKTAMQDTMGQAAALTGGYSSTYAATAGNQAYNAFIEDAYNNLPEYYQMALEAYQMEGQEMYDQLAMLNAADAAEFERMYDSWNANFGNAQQMYQNEYSAWQDSVNNAYNSASLQLQEHGQLYDEAYNTYAAVQNNADTLYAQEYQKWADEVANAMSYAGLANSNYWNTENFNESVRQFNESMAQQKYEFSQEMAYRNASLAQDQAEFLYNAGINGSSGLKEPSETQMQKALEAYNTGGDEALDQYVDSLPSDIDRNIIGEYIYGSENSTGYGVPPLQLQDWLMEDDTDNWGFVGGDDNDDTYTFRDDIKSFKELKELIQNTDLSDEEKEAFLNMLREQSKR